MTSRKSITQVTFLEGPWTGLVGFVIGSEVAAGEEQWDDDLNFPTILYPDRTEGFGWYQLVEGADPGDSSKPTEYQWTTE